MFLSIVIPLYNKERSISKTIESVLAQTYQDFEIIIVNDGCTDNSVAEVQEFKEAKISLIHQENKGVSEARNRGVLEATSEWIAFLDADDLWDERYLEEMLAFMNEYPDAKMYGANKHVLGTGGVIETSHPLPNNFKGYLKGFFDLATKRGLFFNFLSAVIVNRKSAVECGLFDKSLTYGEDIDFIIRFAALNQVAFYNKKLLYYRNDSENKAMQRLHPFQSTVISAVLNGKYDSFQSRYPGFALFIENLKFRYLTINSFHRYNFDKKLFSGYVNNISFSIGYKKLYLFLPLSVIKFIAKRR